MNGKKNQKLKKNLARLLAVSLCAGVGGTGAFLLPVTAGASEIKTQSAGVNSESVLSAGEKTAQTNALQGTITNLITGNFTAIFFEYLERGTLTGLGTLASNTENEGMAQALSITKRLLGNPQSTALGNIQKQCTQILNQLNALQKSMDSNFKYVEDLLRQIQAGSAKTAYTNLAKDLDTYKTRYTMILQKYVDLVNSLDAYAASGGSAAAQKDLKEKYEDINALYEAANGISSRTQDSFNFADDLNHILSAISNYNSGAPFKDSKGYYPISDTSKWGAKDSRDTYISTYHDMILTKEDMEHEVYTDMVAQLNKTADIVSTYLTCYQYYVEFAAQKIYATPYAELGIAEISSERDKQHYIDKMWSDYNDTYYRAMRGLAQALAEYDDEMAGAMRPYDTNATLYFADSRNSIRWGEYNGKIYHEPLYSESDLKEMVSRGENTRKKTSDKMQIYQFRPYGSAKTYMVRKTNSSQTDILAGDLEFDAGKFDDVAGFMGWNHYGPTCDYVNLITAPTSPTHISLLHSDSDLSELLTASGKGSTGLNLASWLKEHGMTEIPSGADYLITGNTTWNPHNALAFANNDADYFWINVSKPLTLSASNVVNLDAENDIDDNGGTKNKPVMAMYSGKPVVAFYLPTHDYADIYAYYKDDESKTHLSSRVVPESGRAVILKIRPHEGHYIYSLQLLDRHEYNEKKKVVVLDDLLGESVKGNDNSGTSSGTIVDPLASVEPDADGYYTFCVNVPYRDAEVRLLTGAEKDLTEKPAKYEVTLSDNDSSSTVSGYDKDEGILAFDGHSGQTSLKTAEKKTVSVTVMPYSSYLCSSLEFYTKDGKKIDTETLSVKDVTSDTGKYVPNEKTFTFQMPAQDVVVKAVYKKGYQVNLTKDSTCMLKFAGSDEEYLDSGWNVLPRTFSANASVRLNAMSLDSFRYISDYSVISTTRSKNYSVSPKGYRLYDSDKNQYMQEVELVMPDSDVTVKALTESRNSTKKNARILSVYGSGTISFENTGSAIVQAGPGETVSLQVSPAGSRTAKVAVTSSADKSAVKCTKDTASGLYQFTMPDSDVDIRCSFTAAADIAIRKPTGLKLKNVKKQSLRVTAEKTGTITGYRIAYRISGKNHKWNIKTAKTGNRNLNVTISGLKKGKTYQCRIRAYLKKEKETYFSAYTGKKSVRIQR